MGKVLLSTSIWNQGTQERTRHREKERERERESKPVKKKRERLPSLSVLTDISGVVKAVEHLSYSDRSEVVSETQHRTDDTLQL